MKYRKFALALLASLSAETPAAELVNAPAGAVKQLEVSAAGVQNYSCVAKENSYAWVFQGPEASLFDTSGHKIGAHSAGPIWKLLDGSAVVGEKVSEAPAPDAQAIPWLLLRVKSHTGDGRLTNTAWIRRINTHGGVTPAQGCDAAHTGVTIGVPYTANYEFFR
jgi:hypothetical protein